MKLNSAQFNRFVELLSGIHDELKRGKGLEQELSFKQQIDGLHTTLFGWPCDSFTPLADLLKLNSLQEVAYHIINSDRFRWHIRGHVPIWHQDKWVCTEYQGFLLWLNLRDSFVAYGALHENWETEELKFMRSCLKPGGTMVDIGANIGIYTLHAARAVGPTGHVIAFEPMEETYQWLCRTVRENGFQDRCELFRDALGSTNAQGTFIKSTHATNPGASYVQDKSSSSSNQRININIRKLDDVPISTPIDFVKIDVEGYEPLVLEGGRELLGQHKPVMLAEFFPRALEVVGGSSAKSFVQQLNTLGYTVTKFDDGPGRLLTPEDVEQYENIPEPFNVVCLPT